MLPEYANTVKATVARITVSNAFDAAVTPTNQLIKSNPTACETMPPTGIAEASASLTPVPSAHFVPKSFGEYHNQPKASDQN